LPMSDLVISLKPMHIISQKKLREFWLKHPKAEFELRKWFLFCRKAQWKSPSDIKSVFSSASFLHNNRVVFNISGNTFRLVIKLAYQNRRIYVRFVGTHAEYDKIHADTI